MNLSFGCGLVPSGSTPVVEETGIKTQGSGLVIIAIVYFDSSTADRRDRVDKVPRLSHPGQNFQRQVLRGSGLPAMVMRVIMQLALRSHELPTRWLNRLIPVVHCTERFFFDPTQDRPGV